MGLIKRFGIYALAGAATLTFGMPKVRDEVGARPGERPIKSETTAEDLRDAQLVIVRPYYVYEGDITPFSTCSIDVPGTTPGNVPSVTVKNGDKVVLQIPDDLDDLTMTYRSGVNVPFLKDEEKIEISNPDDKGYKAVTLSFSGLSKDSARFGDFAEVDCKLPSVMQRNLDPVARAKTVLRINFDR